MKSAALTQPSLITKRAERPFQKPSVSIVVPTYNEESILSDNLLTLFNYMKSLDKACLWEMLIVNDGSTDRTGTLAEQFARGRKNVHVFHHMVNFGLGQALRTAFNQCRGDYVITIDADLSYSPDHIQRLLDEVQKPQVKIVIASPYMPSGKISNIPFLRKIMSRIANRFLSLMASGRIYTLTGLVRAYDRIFIQNLNLKAMDIEVNPEIIYKSQMLRGRIVEIPAHLDWSFINSKGKARRSSLKMLRSIIASLMSGFIFRPFIFFISIGALLFFISLYIICWIFIHIFNVYQTIQTTGGYFDGRFTLAVATVFKERPHAFLIGGFILVIAIQLCSLGVLSIQNKRYFEELFHLNSSKFNGPPSCRGAETPENPSEKEQFFRKMNEG
jgi:glycosyltransferase involved in cell wall biosynthesis